MRNFGQIEEEFREQNLKNKYFLRPEKIVAFVFFLHLHYSNSG